LGDALGYPIEFASLSNILKRLGPGAPEDLPRDWQTRNHLWWHADDVVYGGRDDPRLSTVQWPRPVPCAERDPACLAPLALHPDRTRRQKGDGPRLARLAGRRANAARTTRAGEHVPLRARADSGGGGGGRGGADTDHGSWW